MSVFLEVKKKIHVVVTREQVRGAGLSGRPVHQGGHMGADHSSLSLLSDSSQDRQARRRHTEVANFDFRDSQDTNCRQGVNCSSLL